VLGLGAGQIGGDDLSESEVGRFLGEALDLGYRLIDTAPSYGLSEERIGRHLGSRRDEFILVNKLGYGVPGIPDWTPACISAGIDKALRKLGTDRLDVGLLHSCPRDLAEDPGIRGALATAISQGKLIAAGYSGENEPLAAAATLEPYGVLMASVNLFDQNVLAGPVATAQSRGAGFLAKRPLGNAPWRYPDRPAGDYCEPLRTLT
jgi:aryl-alcohol dehydrogenase-like predicted oxidoreductase